MEDLRALAKQFYNEGNLHEAIRYADALLHPSSTDAMLWHIRGSSHRLLNNNALALADLTKCLNLIPKEARVLLYRSEVYFDLGQYKEALADMKKAKSLNKKMLDSDDYLLLGKILCKLDDRSGACRAFEETVKLDPNCHEAWHLLTRIFFCLKKHKSVIDAASKAIELKPNDDVALELRGRVYRLENRFDEAFKDLARAVNIATLKKSTRVWALWKEIGFAAVEADDYHDAFAHLSHAINLAPSEEGDLFFWRGMSSYQLGVSHYPSAIEDMQRALVLTPKNERIKKELAKVIQASQYNTPPSRLEPGMKSFVSSAASAPAMHDVFPPPTPSAPPNDEYQPVSYDASWCSWHRPVSSRTNIQSNQSSKSDDSDISNRRTFRPGSPVIEL
jgi:tetratricopeptide (TPR) repeat protein